MLNLHDGRSNATLMRVICGLFVCLFAIPAMPAAWPPRVTVPFLLDHNRVFVDLKFPRADGKVRNARAFVDMGGADFTFAEGLAKELRLEQAKTLDIRIGGAPLFIDYTKVTAEIYGVKSIARAGTVEVNLPAVVLMNYDVVFDYKARTMTLASPGTIRHEGIRIPCRVNPKTGLISIQIGIGSHGYPVTIYNGAAYTWIRRPVVRGWVEAHPDWLRGMGAIGDGNMNGTEAETTALLARIPVVDIGTLALKDVGLVGYTETIKPGKEEFFDWYSKKAPQAVIGFIGGNILKSFRVEIDYVNHATYWLQETGIDHDDMDEVPVVLRPERDGSYTVIGICERNGKKLIDGVLPGDKLISVGNLAVRIATFGTVLQALHGHPGDTRVLVLERNGKRLQVAAKVAQL
jgi:hypothetical protein